MTNPQCLQSEVSLHLQDIYVCSYTIFSGYYGDPMKEGSRCLPCDCDKEGSSSNICDGQTGQCPCIDGVEGRMCDTCVADNSELEDGKCVCEYY